MPKQSPVLRQQDLQEQIPMCIFFSVSSCRQSFDLSQSLPILVCIAFSLCDLYLRNEVAELFL